MTIKHPCVFLSHSPDSPEHVDRVLALAARLHRDGVDAWLERYEESPAEGWPRWMQRQITGRAAAEIRGLQVK